MPHSPAPQYFENQWPIIKMKTSSVVAIGKDRMGLVLLQQLRELSLLDLYDGSLEKSHFKTIFI